MVAHENWKVSGEGGKKCSDQLRNQTSFVLNTVPISNGLPVKQSQNCQSKSVHLHVHLHSSDENTKHKSNGKTSRGLQV